MIIAVAVNYVSDERPCSRPNQVALLLDRSMKYTPTSGREDQQSWYGKHEISIHVTSVYHRTAGAADLARRTYIHVFDRYD